MTIYRKDPDAVIDYKFDWSSWLGSDRISTSSWDVDGVTVDSASNTDRTTTVWLSGGTAGSYATVTNTITTTGGRSDDRTITLSIVER